MSYLKRADTVAYIRLTLCILRNLATKPKHSAFSLQDVRDNGDNISSKSKMQALILDYLLSFILSRSLDTLIIYVHFHRIVGRQAFVCSASRKKKTIKHLISRKLSILLWHFHPIAFKQYILDGRRMRAQVYTPSNSKNNMNIFEKTYQRPRSLRFVRHLVFRC